MNRNASDTEKVEKQPKKFGTFGGVLTLSVLTILGVIMFLGLLGWGRALATI